MLPFISLLVLRASLGVHAATKTWTRLPIHQQVNMTDDLTPFVPTTDVSLGTPPQNISMLVNIGSQPVLAITPECLFCPSDGMYDQSYSSSAQVNTSATIGGSDLAGTTGNETITLGGVLQEPQAPTIFINQMSAEYRPRFMGGQFGLYVPNNETRRASSVLAELEKHGQLLNPVWGLRLGGQNPQLTIGALDPNDYEGEINWVPTVNDGPVISIDALKGYQGNVVPAQYPVNAVIDTLSKNIYIPELDVFVMNESLVGPHDMINIYPPNNRTFGVSCNGTTQAIVDFSVQINGVDYPVKREDVVRPNTIFAAKNVCDTAIMESSSAQYVLGVTFLRSVYLAYRFPTSSCPGYWGFATPKGVSLPTSTTKQNPRVTPTDASSCLAFTAPTSTPTPTIQSGTGGSMMGSNGVKYQVYGRPSEAQVELKAVGELPALKAVGAVSGFA